MMRLSPIPVPTAYGPALAAPPRQRGPVTLSHHELHVLIRAEGDIPMAERLDWRVADLREPAR